MGTGTSEGRPTRANAVDRYQVDARSGTVRVRAVFDNATPPDAGQFARL